MITQETSEMISRAYREINASRSLLHRVGALLLTIDNKHATIGLSCDGKGFDLIGISPKFAESFIKAYIENKRAELSELQERARIELEGQK